MIHPPFIVLEGIDGAGTTTQAALLKKHLRQAGIPVFDTKQPSSGRIGKMIREGLRRQWEGPLRFDRDTPLNADRTGHAPSWQTLALLFAADRLDHLHNEILPALAAGNVVVCDRYDLSTWVYQGVASADAGYSSDAWLRDLNSHARRPDLTIVLRVSPEEAGRRRVMRDDTPEIYETDAMQRKVAAAYEDAARWFGQDNIVFLDGHGSADAVAERILHTVITTFPDTISTRYIR